VIDWINQAEACLFAVWNYMAAVQGRIIPIKNIRNGRKNLHFVNNMLIIWPKGGFYQFFQKKRKKVKFFREKPLPNSQKIL